ncbi:MAG: cellulase family glycosylhydrolase [Litorilituus sp.]|jgi:endoglucanase|nr:cellulase family glycosylhydrolase [Litorilituus sp.]
MITRNQSNITCSNLQGSAFKTALIFTVLLLLSACGGSSSDNPSHIPIQSTVPSTSITPETPVNSATLLSIEAEDYVRFFDATPGNEGNTFRNDDVDIEALTDESGYCVGWTEIGEWLEYDVVLTAGRYIISTQVASFENGASYSVLFNGNQVGTDLVNQTGGWQTFEQHDVAAIEVAEGAHILRIDISSGPFNIDSITFKPDDGSFVPPVAELPFELPEVDVVTEPNPISAKTAVSEMGIGINLGNTLDAPYEGEWAPEAQEVFLSDFNTAGFKHVRIPVTWDNRSQKTAPYTIDEAALNRVETVVNWALEHDLYVILNAHHDNWIKTDYTSQSKRNRLDAIWLQIVERFKQKSAKLMFEVLNEPNGLSVSQVDEINVRILHIIRRANPNRLVVFSGNGFTPIGALLSAAIPDTEDEYLIGNFHAYDPWAFAGQCLQRWGSETDANELENIYKQAQQWSITHDIPVTVNEFGVAKFDFIAPENVCNQEDRLQYIDSHVKYATEYGVGATFWDDAGSFSTYDRITRTWGPEKDILVAPNHP